MRLETANAANGKQVRLTASPERAREWSSGTVVIRPRRPQVAVRRPDGSILSRSDLPENGARWTSGRKMVVVECVRSGLISAEDACRRYDLSAPELHEWSAAALPERHAPKFWSERPGCGSLNKPIKVGELDIDPEEETVAVRGTPVALSRSEWEVLRAIAEGAGKVVSTAMLMSVLYGTQGSSAGSKIVDVLICRLRRKLGSEGERIGSVWGRGYRLVG